jgi:hypothetical protein
MAIACGWSWAWVKMGSIFFCNRKEKKGKKQERETRSKSREPRDKSRETRSEKQEPRDKNQEACLPTGRQEVELFAVRFLCACLPQAGLCAFASKKKKETRSERQEPRAKKQETRAESQEARDKSREPRSKRQEARDKRIKSRFLPAYRRQDSSILLPFFKFLPPKNRGGLPFYGCLIHHKQGIFLSNAACRDACILLK